MNIHHDKQVELPSGTLNFTDQGNGHPLVVLHSNPGHVDDFAVVIPELSRYCRVIAVHWPGYGVSPSAHPEQTSAFTLYQVFVELMDYLTLSKAVIMGHSVGGNVAARYAIEFPQRVSGLILITSGGFTPASFLVRAFCRLQGSRFALPLGVFTEWTITGKNATTKEIIKRSKTLHSDNAVKQAVKGVWRSFNDPGHDLTKSAKAIRQPTLLVFGRHDPVIRCKRDGRVARTAIAHSQYLELATGHFPFAEAPKEFLLGVLRFLMPIVQGKPLPPTNKALKSHLAEA